MAATVITNFIAKALFKKKGAIANNKAVEFSANALEQRLKRVGIDPNAITSENELNQILSAVKQAEDAAFSQRFGNTLSGSKFDRVGEVFDMTGKKLDSSRGIMGGTQIDEKSLKEGLMKTDNPFSDLVKTTDQGPKTLAEREAEVLARLEKENTEAAQRIRDRKKEVPTSIDQESFLQRIKKAVDEDRAIKASNEEGIASMKNKLDESEGTYSFGFKKGKEFQLNASSMGKGSLKEIVDSGELVGDDLDFAINILRDRKATGGRAGFSKGSGLKTLFNFLNKKSPYQASKDYLKSIKTRVQAGKEAEVAGEVIPIAATGALITNQVKKKLKAMNEEQKKEFKKEMEKKADGGRIGLLAGSVPKVLKFLKSKKKIDEAVNNIFPTGDYKYDAQMAADSLVENNPKIFGGKLYEDLDMDTQMEVYGAVIGPIQNNALAVSRMKKATRPEKTLASMKEGKGINMSDPDIADEFARFMKETDPKGTKELEQKLQLENFKTKDRSENADGGRIGLKAGMTKRAFLKLMGSVGLGVGAAKSGIFSGLGKGATKQVAKEVAQQTTSGMPPPYFFKLAEKIKNMGSDVTSTTERTISKSLKSKDGNAEYILEENMVSGDTIIKKVNKEGDDMITDVQIMEYRMGEPVKTVDGKVVTTPNEYEEVTEVNKRIYKDDYNASDYTDGIEEIELKKIIEEVDDQAPSIKYASGGLAYMLGE